MAWSARIVKGWSKLDEFTRILSSPIPSRTRMIFSPAGSMAPRPGKGYFYFEEEPGRDERRRGGELKLLDALKLRSTPAHGSRTGVASIWQLITALGYAPYIVAPSSTNIDRPTIEARDQSCRPHRSAPSGHLCRSRTKSPGPDR
jgi:hypothetical protein